MVLYKALLPKRNILSDTLKITILAQLFTTVYLLSIKNLTLNSYKYKYIIAVAI